MEGPSSRLNAIEAGPQKVAIRKNSDGDSEADVAGDIKTHFRVCRFMMETGSTELLVHEEFKYFTTSPALKLSLHLFSF